MFLNDTARNGGPARSLHTILAHLDPDDVYRAVVLPRAGVVSDLLAPVCETLVFVPDFVENPVEPYRRAFRREDLDAPWALRGARAAGNVVKMGRAMTSLSRLVERGGFDLLYCNGTTADFVGATVGALTETPVLWHVRYTEVPAALRSVHAALAASHTVRRILCVSQAAAKMFEGAARKKVAVVHNAVEMGGVERGHARRALGLPADAFVFGAHGRVLPRKGFLELLGAGARVLAELSEGERERTWFVIVGDTPEDIGADHLEACRREAARLGIADRVRFVGFQADVLPWVSDFDVEVVPSVYEDPLPRAVIEAMACGVPVIGTDVGGIGELLGAGGGTLVPPRDVHALARAMLAYRRNELLRRTHGERGRARAIAEFSAPRHAARIRQEIAATVFG